MENISKLITEERNESSENIDRLSTIEMVRIINEQDALVAAAVEKELPSVAKAIDAVYDRVMNGGRLVYCGAGTSGRLGVLDASECWPTYGSKSVIGLIAGGRDAMFDAQEGVEDNSGLCAEDLKEIEFCTKDTLVGIAASGRTPYVIGGLQYAESLGALTVSLTCNPDSKMAKLAQISISPVVGPEVVTGSTRMKSGTAQKMVLNMLSTGLMIRLGKVYKNLMVDVQPTNAKLVERAKNIVMQAADTDYTHAQEMLERTDYDVKLAITAIVSHTNVEQARLLLKENNGRISVKAGK